MRSRRNVSSGWPDGARDQHAEHVRARVVHPALARLVHQRQRRRAAHPLVRRGAARSGSAGPESEASRRSPSGSGSAPGGASDDARSPSRNVSRSRTRDRPLRRHGVVERAVEARQHPAIGELGQQPIDRLVEAQRALLDQDHRRRGRDRLGHRGDAEDRVAAHRLAAAERLRADRVDVHLAAAADQRDEPRHAAALDVAGHDVVHAAQPRSESAAPAIACSSIGLAAEIGRPRIQE